MLIVTDGLRWQEVFGGAERGLIGRAGGVGDTTAVLRDYWRETAEARREVLLPFLWGTIEKRGQVFGDRGRGSNAAVSNGLKFSYPGYNELFTGAADKRIDSNDYPANPNITVFEWLNRKAAYRGKVAAVTTWGAFSRILNRERSGIPVVAGWEAPFAKPVGARQQLLNELYRTTIRLWDDNALDGLMHQVLLEVLRTSKPRVLFVGYGETDEWAHARRYDLTLQSAHRVDLFIGELWRLMQSMPEYRGSTTFIVTTDHGRGDGPDGWTRHGETVDGAENIWVAVMGPDTEPLGARANVSAITQSQVAATIAALLGEDWLAASPGAAAPIAGVTHPVRR